MALIHELKRRRVFRLAAFYIVGAWVALQVAALAFPGFGIPDEAIRYVWYGAIALFPIVVIISWRYDVSAGGFSRTADSATEPNLPLQGSDYVLLTSLFLVALVAVFAILGEVLDTRTGETTADVMQTSNDKAETEVVRTRNPNSIAVMPFVNMSTDPENEFFADGISEEILNELVKVQSLLVTSRSSSFTFKNQNLDIPSIAERLNVAHVLEGSVRKSGNDIRITAQLIDAENDVHLWSETYDRKFENIFDIQEEIAVAIADALHVALIGGEAKVARTDPQAYALYLRATTISGNRDNYQLRKTLLTQALEIDPSFAPAWVALGGNHFMAEASFGYFTGGEGYELARAAFERAIAIDPDNANAHGGIAHLEFMGYRNFDAAAGYFIRALNLSAGNADILRSAALMRRSLGRFDESIELFERALIIDPLTPSVRHGETFWMANRLDEAESFLQSLETPFRHYFLVMVDISRGKPDAALKLAQQYEYGIWTRLIETICYYDLGDMPASNAALAQLELAEGGSYQKAIARAYRGETDEAFEALEQAYQLKDAGLFDLMVDPFLINLHGDPRWKPFLGKAGFPVDSI